MEGGRDMSILVALTKDGKCRVLHNVDDVIFGLRSNEKSYSINCQDILDEIFKDNQTLVDEAAIRCAKKAYSEEIS